MKPSLRVLMTLLSLMALGVFAAACGGDDADTATTAEATPTPAAEGGASVGAIQRDEANAGKSITIGSKNFAEQYILGEIYAQGLEAAGFKVTKQLDLGSEQVAYRSLKRGTVDAYPEYTGTALTSFYRVKIADIPRDKDEAFTQLAQEAKADKLTALPQTSFEDTFRIVSTKEIASKYGNPKTLTELAAKAKTGSSVSGFPECRQRTDCLIGLKNVYQWEPEFVSSQGKYADLKAKQSEFTFGFSTDGELATGEYVTYEDDKQLFPPYFVSLMVNEQGVKTLGESGQAVVEQVQKPLTETVMRELNSRVTLDKEKPEDVAKAYLSEVGLVKAGA